ncbi:hypothetical protein IKQ19_13995 [Candidatus Saccharibacteria bacterium]|nr:hypothetical protein [Candidatus Saccharibacteria bacterium]
MSRLQKVGLVAFVAFVAFAVTFSYLTKSQFIKMPEKPWHMQPFTDADSLTAEYTGKYELLGKKSLLSRFADSSRVTVAILVDAWGVPFDEHLLAEDFSIFKDLPHREFLHHRLANRTRHAEFAELRIPGDSTRPHDGVYLFGGDSLEYGRNLYIDSLGYGVRLFCQKCRDSVMAAMLDSVLAAVAVDSASPVKNVAWTTQGSRDGDRAKLHATLRLIADVTRRHPEARFIVQGTHRPILGDPKIRRESFAHWVPVVIF